MAKRIEPKIHLTVIARYQHQAESARRFEADEVVIAGDLYTEMARITGAKLYKSPLNRGMLLGGFDVIYDCVGEADTLSDSLRWARAGGTVVMVGVSLSALKIDLNPVWYQEVNLIGSHTFGYETWRGREVHSYDLVIEMSQAGEVNHEGLITHRFPFEGYKQAIATAMDKRRNSIKVVLEY
jgi:threonine dehydrogenase-like Zn-dependent dehydrogenase